jgi:hypothetical protein
VYSWLRIAGSLERGCIECFSLRLDEEDRSKEFRFGKVRQ